MSFMNLCGEYGATANHQQINNKNKCLKLLLSGYAAEDFLKMKKLICFK